LAAAMEPADQRRDDGPVAAAASASAAAAMEPADQRRDDQQGDSLTIADDALPQWSPPTSGGTTGGHLHRASRGPRAAMEPADQRRDDLARDPGAALALPAAMEPADQRRDDLRAIATFGRPSTPQWSPPTSGGTTTYLPSITTRASSAAMEPADQRRDDRPFLSDSCLSFCSRNGARRPAAGRPGPASAPPRRPGPQWSPPTSGGTTVSGTTWTVTRGASAMEPADQRRDDSPVMTSSCRKGLVRNGARRPAAGRLEHDTLHGHVERFRNGARRPAAGRP